MLPSQQPLLPAFDPGRRWLPRAQDGPGGPGEPTLCFFPAPASPAGMALQTPSALGPAAAQARWAAGGCGGGFCGGNLRFPLSGCCMSTFPAGAVVQDLEVSRLLFSHSPVLPSRVSHAPWPGLAPLHPALLSIPSLGLSSPCCSQAGQPMDRPPLPPRCPAMSPPPSTHSQSPPFPGDGDPHPQSQPSGQ